MVISGTDSNDKVHPILVDSSGRPYVILSDGTNNVIINEDGELRVNNTDGLITATEDYAGAETDTVIINPGATEKIEVHNIFVSTNVNNVDVIVKFATSGDIIFKLYTSQQQTANSEILHMVGAANENVEITCGAGTFISITYHLVE